MEPSNLNTPRDEEVVLAGCLRAQWPALPDNGFSARVIAALPPAAARPARWPWLAYFGGGAAGALFAFARAGSWSDFFSGLHQASGALSALAFVFAEPWLLLGLTITACSLLIAAPFTRRRAHLW